MPASQPASCNTYVPSGITKRRAERFTPSHFTEAAGAEVVPVPKHHSRKFCGDYIGIIFIALGSGTLIV
jgi:hypothetical protein